MSTEFDFRNKCLIVATDDTAVTVLPLRHIVALGADYESLCISVGAFGESVDFKANSATELSNVIEWFISEQQ